MHHKISGRSQQKYEDKSENNKVSNKSEKVEETKFENESKH